MKKNLTCMTGFKIYEGLKTLSINLISPRKYLVGSFSILKHHKEIIRSSVFTNTKNKLWCARCVYLSVHFCFFKETWGQQNKTQTFLHPVSFNQRKKCLHKKSSQYFFSEKKKKKKPKGRILPEKKISSIKKILFGFQSWKNSQIHLKKIIWFQTLKKY